MANSLKSIADIFERKLFRIPDYQRGYSWELKQLNDFWDDLGRLMDGKYHYTGLLTIRKVDLRDDDKFGEWKKDKWLIESGFEPYYIVDGQQRLTTIILFIRAILEKLKDDEMLAYNRKESIEEKYIKRATESLKSYIFGYEYNDPSNRFLIANIFGDSSEVYREPMTVYTVNLQNAFAFFQEKLKHMHHGELDKLFKKLTLRLQFNLYEIEDELDEFVVFETTNNRGKPLSKLELLKNRLIFLTTILDNDNTGQQKELFETQRSDLRLQINDAWRKIYEYLGKNEKNLLDDDEFLRNHFYLYYGYDTDTAASYDKILLDEKFTSKDALQGKLGIKDIEKFTDSIGKSAKQWFRVNNPEHSSAHFSIAEVDWLLKIQRQNFKPFFSCLTVLLLKKTENDLFLKIIKEMERYYFLVFDLSKRRSNTGVSYFYQRAHAIWRDKKSGLHLLNDLKERIENPTIGHDFSLKRFKSRVLEDLFNNTDGVKDGYYGWSALSYVLFEYELHLQGREDSKVDWRKNKNTIEHIYPKNPKDKCWEEPFQGFSIEERRYLLNSIGNLLMLSRSKNSAQRNYCFAYKRVHEKNGKKEGYVYGSFSEIEVSEYKEWNAQAILERGLKIFAFIEKRWKITLGDINQKKDLLYLKFLESKEKEDV
mgnify:CR=1 FL=1